MVFRYEDDYLVLLNKEDDGAVIKEMCPIFTDSGSGFVFTTELPVSGRLWFIYLNLKSGPQHSCWLYSLRAQKGLPPYDSPHSKILKRSIPLSYLCALFRKSCQHNLIEAFAGQLVRL